MRRFSRLAMLFAALACLCAPAGAAPPKIAIFSFQLIDTSLSGEKNGSKAEDKRIEAVSQQLRSLVQKSGKFAVVDVAPVKDEVAKVNLATCNGCDAALAKKLGADLALVGTVQKVSELILNVNLYVRDASSGKLVGVMSADMRGNTDESWSHTISWLVRNRLTQPGFGEKK